MTITLSPKQKNAVTLIAAIFTIVSGGIRIIESDTVKRVYPSLHNFTQKFEKLIDYSAGKEAPSSNKITSDFFDIFFYSVAFFITVRALLYLARKFYNHSDYKDMQAWKAKVLRIADGFTSDDMKWFEVSSLESDFCLKSLDDRIKILSGCPEPLREKISYECARLGSIIYKRQERIDYVNKFLFRTFFLVVSVNVIVFWIRYTLIKFPLTT